MGTAESNDIIKCDVCGCLDCRRISMRYISYNLRTEYYHCPRCNKYWHEDILIKPESKNERQHI